MKFLNSFFTSSPHGNRGLTTAQVMRTVCYAAVPGILTQIYFFGYGVLIQLAICIATALASEAIILSLREKQVRATLNDCSALLTGLLIAISIPPLAPWWIAVIGTAFAIIIVKQLYGGLGFNLFNPAMAAYVLLLISFPVAMTNWLPPGELMTYQIGFLDALSTIFTDFTVDGYSIIQLKMAADGTSMATPLDNFKTQLDLGFTASEIAATELYNQYGGTGWAWVNLAYLIGGLYLLKRGLIRWHIPVAILVTMVVFSFFIVVFDADQALSPTMHLFTGATMLGAFFIATDPVSASTTVKGRLVFGTLVGLLIIIIRNYGGYPDGVAFAVLLANICVPLIDYYTRPVTYGHRAR